MERVNRFSLNNGKIEMTNESKPKLNAQIKFQLEEQTVSAQVLSRQSKRSEKHKNWVNASKQGEYHAVWIGQKQYRV